MMIYWVGHLKIKQIGVVELFNRKLIMNEFKSSLNDNNQTEAPVVTEIIPEEDYASN